MAAAAKTKARARAGSDRGQVITQKCPRTLILKSESSGRAAAAIENSSDKSHRPKDEGFATESRSAVRANFVISAVISPNVRADRIQPPRFRGHFSLTQRAWHLPWDIWSAIEKERQSGHPIVSGRMGLHWPER